MLTASVLYRQALPYAVRRETRVQVLHSGTVVADSDLDPVWLPVGGTVEAALTDRVTRTLRMQVQPQLFPELETDVLSPYVAVVKIFTGVGYPDGSREIFPIFTGRVTDAVLGTDGSVNIVGDDLAADVIGFEFEAPQLSITGALITSEIRRLITQALPGAVFGTSDVTDGPVPALVWDTDRGQALDDLAAALHARWYALGDGSFVIRKYPYTAGTPVATLADASGGLNVTAARTISRAGGANSVTVVSERMDGSAPIRVTARDTMPTSPTFFGGPYGKVSQVIKVQTPLTAAGAQELAQAQLASQQALTDTWAIECISDSTLEPGDTVAISYRGVNGVQVLDRITYPLLAGPPMRLATRASVPEPVTS